VTARERLERELNYSAAAVYCFATALVIAGLWWLS
jgi:hypothetical protein